VLILQANEHTTRFPFIFSIMANNNNNNALFGEGWQNNDDDDNDNDNVVIDIEDDEDHDDPTLDGGVAVDNSSSGSATAKRSSSDCDLILYIYCQKPLDIAPDHPIMRPGITVSIGLEKNTKLSAVFRRYVDFCNESSGKEHSIKYRDLEFVHCQLLDEHETAETSALMKNDRILVRKVQKAEREAEAERKRALREADRVYFQQMRQLMPDLGASRVADVILDCKGKLMDTNGRHQRVLSTGVRAHSAMLSRRCPWLKNIILQARNKARQEALEEEKEDTSDTPEERTTGATEIEDEEDEMHVAEEERREKNGHGGVVSGDIDMIDDDDDDDDRSFDSHEDGEPARVEEDNADVFSSAHLSHSRSDKDLLLVTIPDHSPEAVKILLEYCYTNRVVSLGYDAFVQSCKTRPSKHQGPVAPFHSSHHSSKKWPGNGSPQVSFSVALAAIRIAEESGMRRLSLMCEVAASQLVTTDNVTEALMMSTSQKSISGNDLPYLRKACMDVILARGPRGVLDLERSASFRTALDSQQAVIVPTLLKGTMEAVTSWEASKGIKRDSSEISYSSFEELDKEDKYAREKERRKRRKRPSDVDPEELYEDPIFGTWEADAAKRSLKRMSQHLDAINRRTATVSRGGSSFFATGSQRTSRRRRSKS